MLGFVKLAYCFFASLYGPLLLDTGMTVERNKIHRRVVPYNRGLLLKYLGLINVERVGHCINSCLGRTTTLGDNQSGDKKSLPRTPSHVQMHKPKTPLDISTPIKILNLEHPFRSVHYVAA
ncbi:hypothetical protein POM88_007901 [Heracleum sosnowskyi]|uniref:Secreted protein n=1 Tax=Heracleum sosnowskyi TaxID=360622 RepID=A0AAD8J7N7_9APIA|nr:hypothetical protein POM88_007901 [Heracleum sosnowskyi]